MNGGFSPFQLLMGTNPSVPNVVESNLPALEPSVGISQQVEKHLRTMRTARESFVKAESSAKIMRALKSQVRTCNDVHVDNGEKVWYKRKNSKSWHGPALV